MRVYNDDIFTQTSTSATITSPAHQLTHMAGFCAQGVFTQTAGSLAASLQAQASNDGATWSNVGSAVAVSGTTAFLLNTADVFYDQVRFVLTVTGGTCSIAAKINAKGF